MMTQHNAASEDNIAAELLKATTSDENLGTWLKLYNCVWNTEKIPLDWGSVTIVKIP